MIILMADIFQDPSEMNEDTAVLLGEAFLPDNTGDSVIIKLCLSMDHFLDCRLAAEGKEEVYVVATTEDNFDIVRKHMQYPTDLAFYLKEGGYELHEVTDEESKTILIL